MAPKYGPGLGKILLDDLNCFGNETDILQCEHSDWGTSDCDHSEDVAVNCRESYNICFYLL